MFLQVNGLCSGYGRGTVLHGVDLEVDRGEVLGLLGRNGAGKSTLVMTMLGLVPARQGSVRLDGREIVGLRADQVSRHGIAVVPQGRRIWPGLTVGEHVDVVAGRRPKAGGWSRDGVFDLFPNLARRVRQPAGLLSGGEQQMLAIARALLTDPALVLMDEPSEGLAPAVTRQIGEVIGSMAATGVGILLVEQDLRLVFATANRVAVMEKGEVAHTTDTGTFRRQPELAHTLLGVG
ncbi:amino acid/amide ABC transporter ATP-binding protein 2, HAAT family [Haloechinothrix alba]|uniref:Amino acid/amide ABC transporter ATP-binding protein 2, HAAT family n=2 Tax=Haloechinothrix alba TaxID=664784 RepID=A0A238W8B4_9PSEU|nr:amino acid/amide ABC transporter ATP-binding protein 2, HAAT family [Haloechinothrix alba]